MDAKQQVSIILNDLKIAAYEFAKKLGYEKPQVIYNILKGKTLHISPILAEKINKAYPQYSKAWLLSGETPVTEKAKTSNKFFDNGVQKWQIPLIPLEAFAGYGTEQYQDLKDLPYYSIEEFKQADFLIRVNGDSMSPRINGGDIVACKIVSEPSFWQWHKVYVLYTNSQGVLIKRIEECEKKGCIKCVSENAAYPPFDVPLIEIQQVALVIGTISIE